MMDTIRRTWLVWFAASWLLPPTLGYVAVAQDDPRRVIEVRIKSRKVVAPGEAIQVTEGDVVELQWTVDEAVELHLHGYNVELHARPGEPATMIIQADATGRFPITSHGWGDGGHGHDALIYFEVYPR